MSYFKYLDGLRNINYIKRNNSFTTFSTEYNHLLDAQVCYIRDIYVAEEDRKKGIATEMADHIASQAKLDNINYLLGSVDITENEPELSLMSQLSYGFKILNSTNMGILFLYKEI